jgi:peptidoglycan/LPS O-acetylase OafA/YrhL
MKWKVLAGLRFFLAAIVLCYHLKDFVPQYSNDWLCSFGRLNGLAAVLGFLIVSGYSIANSIHKEPRGFYQRRVFRIYPLYFCAILFSLIPFVFLGNKFTILGQDYYQPDVATVLGNFALLQTFFVDSLPSNIVLWTLSIEVFCYLLTPGLAKLNNRFLALLIGLSSTFYVLFPFLQKFLITGSDLPFYSRWKFGIPFCLFLWAWLLGFLYARIEKQSYVKLFVIGYGCVLIGLNSQHIGKIGILTYAMSALILVSASSLKLPPALLKIFDYLGNLSYPLYLFHIPTFILLYGVGITSSFSLLFVAFLVSMAFYHMIDVPLRSKKAQSPSTLTAQS